MSTQPHTTTQEKPAHIVCRFLNRKYGVMRRGDHIPVAVGMTKAQAEKWADRLNLREAWGI